jgi:environmental stress-induced protein Ves
VLSQQRTAFEVEANSFADLERIIAKLEGEGIYAQIGTSNRSNNSIIGEIIIESF